MKTYQLGLLFGLCALTACGAPSNTFDFADENPVLSTREVNSEEHGFRTFMNITERVQTCEIATVVRNRNDEIIRDTQTVINPGEKKFETAGRMAGSAIHKIEQKYGLPSLGITSEILLPFHYTISPDTIRASLNDQPYQLSGAQIADAGDYAEIEFNSCRKRIQEAARFAT